MSSINRRRTILTLAAAASSSWTFTPTPALAFAEADDLPPRTDLDETFDAEADAAVRGGLQFLMSRQSADGSFSAKPLNQESSVQGRWVGVCSLAGLAFLSRGVRSGVGEAGLSLQRLGKYVLSHVQASGFLSATGETSHGPMYDHGFGTLFLAELFGTDRTLDIRPKLSSAVRLIVNTQNDQGGWRYNPKPEEADLSVTVCQMMALRAARNAGIGVPKETIDRGIDYVRRSQNADGGFMYLVTGGESRFPLTAAAVVAMYSAGIYEGPEIDSAIAYLQNNFTANNSLERNPFYYYAHYYSVQAFGQRGGDAWSNWYVKLKRAVLSLRNPKGGWYDFNSLEYGTAMACIILNMPRTVLPIFQR